MQLNREINRLMAGILLIFLIVAFAAAYWAIVGPGTILLREDNPRLVQAEARLIRGDIFDRAGNLLVTSEGQTDQSQRRVYLFPETTSLIGYSSLRYGVGGSEAAYDATLRGDNLNLDASSIIINDTLHRPQEGSDIQLALDLGMQQQIAEALEGLKGAVVIIDVPSGDILTLLSLPSYDPNTLDLNWEQLVSNPDTPFFNRALQGSYQPGGLLETPLMAAALLSNQPIDEFITQATDPVQLPDLEVSCAVRLPFDELSLREAYAFSCPKPFAQLAENIGSETVDAILNTFRFNQPPEIADFQFQSTAEDTLLTPQPLPDGINTDNLTETALGQGNLTVTPLEMAMLAAAIVNDGNAPQPNILLATRAPDSQLWSNVQTVRPTIPYMTESTARQLQDLMRETVAVGAAANAGRAGIDIGGHATLAYSGDQSQAWFIGFATLGGRQGIAVAVVLEDSTDPGLAADIGGIALEAAHERLTQSN